MKNTLNKLAKSILAEAEFKSPAARKRAVTAIVVAVMGKQELRVACENFISKCDRGLARSKNSYAEMKAALEVAK